MKLLLLSLALFGLALISQSIPVEKREANEEDPCSTHCDVNGCKKWCNGKWHEPVKREVSEEEDVTIESDNSSCTCKDGECNRCDDNGCEQVSSCNEKHEALEKRASGEAVLIKLFNSDTSNCKCLDHGYCLSKLNQKDYTEVTGCGENTYYTYCDSTGCRQVRDDLCFCEFGRCEKCDQSGCKIVTKCISGKVEIKSMQCEKCNDEGCIRAYISSSFNSVLNDGCEKECDEGASGDILFEEKCTCKKDENGKDVNCQMCGKYQCKPVTDCSRFATCKCKKGSRDDFYRRCYGYKHGKQDCRTLRTCSEQTRIEDERNKYLCRSCTVDMRHLRIDETFCTIYHITELSKGICHQTVYDYLKALEDKQRA